jgi:hypothetical protein
MDSSLELFLSSRGSTQPWSAEKLAALVTPFHGSDDGGADSAADGMTPELTLTPERLREIADVLRQDAQVDNRAETTEPQRRMVLTTETKLGLLSALSFVCSRHARESQRTPDTADASQVANAELLSAMSSIFDAARADPDPNSWLSVAASLLDVGARDATSSQLPPFAGVPSVDETVTALENSISGTQLELSPLEFPFMLLSRFDARLEALHSVADSVARRQPSAEELRLRESGHSRLPSPLHQDVPRHFEPNLDELAKRMGAGLRGQQLFKSNSARTGPASQPRPKATTPTAGRSNVDHSSSAPTAEDRQAKREAFERRLAEQAAESRKRSRVQVLGNDEAGAAQQQHYFASRKTGQSAPKRPRVSSSDQASPDVSVAAAPPAAPRDILPTHNPTHNPKPLSARESERQKRDESEISKLLVEDNALNAAGRALIEKFLRGDHAMPTAAEILAAQGREVSRENGDLVLEVVLNRNSQYHAERATTEEVTVVFEMTYSTRSYRKLRRSRRTT